MGRRKKTAEQRLADAQPNWVIKTEIKINGRNVEAGTELSIDGERGRFRFVKHVTTPNAEWIDVVGGPNNHKQYRSFRPERVKRVHWKNKTRENN